MSTSSNNNIIFTTYFDYLFIFILIILIEQKYLSWRQSSNIFHIQNIYIKIVIDKININKLY
jgi:hypothetical protein